MKLYAVRDKETGLFVDYYPGACDWFLSGSLGVLWVNKPPGELALKVISSRLNNKHLLEVVTLRIEPTKPCPRCTEPVDFYDYGNAFCGHCGRRLTDESI